MQHILNQIQPPKCRIVADDEPFFDCRRFRALGESELNFIADCEYLYIRQL